MIRHALAVLNYGSYLAISTIMRFICKLTLAAIAGGIIARLVMSTAQYHSVLKAFS